MRQRSRQYLRARLVGLPGSRRAFTLVELLVVIAIVVMLIALSLPSLRRSIRQARTTVCQSNLKEVYISLDIYQTDNNGWLPASMDDDGAKVADTWWSHLADLNPGLHGVLICPDDPWASVLRNQIAAHQFGASGPGSYGLNDFILSSPDSFLANLSRHGPRRPGDTILVGDLGPDVLRAGPDSDGVVYPPKRNLGRMAIDDLYMPGVPADGQVDSWLTGRHRGFINLLTMVGNVKRVSTAATMSRPIASYYETCAAGDCTICLYLDTPHYSLAEGHAYWWTGPVPRP